MRKIAYWRGSPRATKKHELLKLLKLLHVSKKDIFYDLGCGYADTCIWASKYVKMSIGIEDHHYRYSKALQNVANSKRTNIKILKTDVSKAPYGNGSILYSVIDLSINDYRRIQKIIRRGTRLMVFGPPPYPIKPKKIGWFFVMVKPFKRVKDHNEYAYICMGRKNATIFDMYKRIGRKEAKRLKWQISHANWIWKIITP